MSAFQRILLAIAILEIPLQIDTFLFYHEQAAEVGAVGGLNISLMTFALIGLYALWLFEIATRVDIPKRRVMWGIPAVLYLAVMVLSLIAAKNKALTIFELAIVGQAFLLYFYLANRIQSRSDLTFLIGVLGVSLAFQSVIILGTCWMEGPRELSLGIIRAEIHPDGRPTGTLLSPVLAGSFLALLIVPVGALLFTPVSKSLKLLSLFAVTLGALAVAITETRGAIITMTAATMIFGFFMLLRGWLPMWAPITVLVIGAVIAPPLIHVFHHRIQQGDGGSAEARIHLSKIALTLISKRPILGTGAGNCHIAEEIVANSNLYRSEWFYTVHSKYLLVWVETGILGLTAFLAFLFSTLAHGWKSWKVDDRLVATVSLAIVAAILGHMIHLAVDMFNSRQQVQMLWCVAGIVVGIVPLREAIVGATASEPEVNDEFVYVPSDAA